MANFFESMEMDEAVALERLSRLAYELREAYTAILSFHGVADEAGLLGRIRCGDVAEHPAWEHYLGARILADTRAAAREALARRSLKATKATIHILLAEQVGNAFVDQLDGPVAMTQDAMSLRLRNGVTLDVHYAAPDAYAMWWQSGGARAGIDTAPVHADLATAPNHMHLADGRVVADPVTKAGADPVDNIRALVAALLVNPGLGLAG